MTENTVKSIEELTNITCPRNVLWLHTTYEDFIRNPDMIDEAPLKGFEVQCPDLNAAFCLEAKKTSHSVLSISCSRKLLSSSEQVDDGCLLLFHFTITGVEQRTESRIMRSGENSVTVKYPTNVFFDSQSFKYYVSTIKCVIKLIETTELASKHLDGLEHQVQIFAKKFPKSQVENMAFLLKRPNLNGIFSGRESDEAILIKMSYIERALPFSKHLVRYIKAKQESEPVNPDIPIDIILCQISCGKKRTVTEEECINLYLNSSRIGLAFLFVIVSDYITNHLNNDYVLDVLKAADTVNDFRMFKAASDFFLTNINEIVQSDKWKTLAQTYPNCYSRSIIHNIKTQQLLEISSTAPDVSEETDKC